MGLLDDAIRDHIDLLRRRGADPTEIAKAEAEALGPVVREVEEPEVHEDADDLVAGTAPIPAEEIEEFEDEAEGVPFEDDEPFDAAAELEEELPVAADAQSAPVDQATEHFDIFSDEGVDSEADVAIEEDDIEDASLHSVDAAEAPAREEEPPAVTSTGSQDPDGDILEGTPDFLEESPDHDRLWFEQAPPKDFDFEDDK